jgi:hypothetical protein
VSLFPTIRLYAVQPLGQTAGLNEKAVIRYLLLHPDGWQLEKRSSARSGTRSSISMGMVESFQPLILVVMKEVSLHASAYTKGVVSACMDVAADMADVPDVVSDIGAREIREG